jgi:GT2 family glycosyltransferase
MRSGDPRVGVVMITYNRAREVLRTVGHLTRLPEGPRVVVVDNGSTDGTAGLLARWFSQVEVLRSDVNLGAAGRTLGLRHLDTPYVALCDDDTWWEPGSLRRAADLLDSHPRLAVVTGRVLVGPEDREDPICAELLRSPLPREPGMPGPPLLGFLAGASVVRRSALLAVGGFEPRFFIGGEEELLAVDLAARSWWLCYVPELVVHHHPSAQRDAHGRRWHVLRNRLWCSWLRRPVGSALRRTLREAASGPWDRAALRGFVAALAGLPWVLRERRVVPPAVEHGLRLLEAPRPARRPAPRSATAAAPEHALS